jgi:hypothetical protein
MSRFVPFVEEPGESGPRICVRRVDPPQTLMLAASSRLTNTANRTRKFKRFEKGYSQVICQAGQYCSALITFFSAMA